MTFTYQVAPERPSDAEVFSLSYLARVPNVEWLSFLTYAVKSDSDVASIGGTNIVGPGQIVGERAVMTLPSLDHLFHTFQVGVDYKHFEQTVTLGSDGFSSACDLRSAGRQLQRDLPGREVDDPVQCLGHLQYAADQQ